VDITPHSFTVSRMTDLDLATRFLERSRYYLHVEYPAKITAAVRTVPMEELWWRPNPGANSVGNLVLHLAGNIRQWVVSGIGGAPDVRQRHAEFAATGRVEHESTHDAVLGQLHDAVEAADAVLAALPPSSLGHPRRIQGRDTTVFSALYHVVEHFAGHTGQIILLAKQFTPHAVRFYDDTGGLARPLFLPDGGTDVA
jgi:uncharacterized damage-inducible protein DinB